MRSKNKSASRQQTGAGAVALASALLSVAAVLAAYLAWISLSGGTAIGCGPDSGCDKVLHSRFAYWFGMPVSLLALPIYAATALCAFRLRASPQCARGWMIATCGALVVVGAAVWFTAVQVLVIHALCRFCMTAHMAGAIGAILLLWSRTRGAKREVAAVSWTQVGLATVVLLGAMIAGQFIHRPKTFTVSNIPVPHQLQTNTPAPVPAAQARTLAIYGGQFQLPVGDLPLIGSPTAPHVIVSLFDYTCHHCRIMHSVLLQVQRTFSNELAIISLPVPLDPACNALVKQTHPDHVKACEYARLSLAVWRARPADHKTYDDWMFAPERPPTIAEAEKYAAELVGLIGLQTALTDPWVNEQIQRDVAIYETAYRAGQGSMPQLIIGNKVAVGTLPIENVYRLLADELKLKPPATKAVGLVP